MNTPAEMRYVQRTRLIVIAALLLLPSIALRAQTGGRTTSLPSISTSKPDDNPFEVKESKSTGELSRATPIDRAVDPLTYRLGPNDVLALSIPFLTDTPIPVNVSPDNTIVLPRSIGMIDVRGMTLAELRQKVDSLFRKRATMVSRNVSLALVRARSIYITVSGDVNSPGRYALTAADRVTTAIDLANRLPDELPEQLKIELMRRNLNIRTPGSMSAGPGIVGGNGLPVRRVLVRRNDGTIDNSDLLRYRAFGDERDNPTLREGDEVVVKRAEPTAASVAISGAVYDPLVIPYRSGDNTLLLTRLASGLSDDADGAAAFIIRQSPTGTQTVPVNLSDSAALAAQLLQPGDQLVVPQITAPAMPATTGLVAVMGEVGHPSTYPIVPGVTKLTELISAAGGMTPNASLNGAYILRAIDPKGYPRTISPSVDRKAEVSGSTLMLDDTLRYQLDYEYQMNRVSTDFMALFERGDATKDVTLKHGDQIVIPRNPRQVFVRGRVTHPGWVDFKPGMTCEQYVAAAGGFTDAADKDRVTLMRYGSGAWEKGEKAIALAGDQIYVPGELAQPPRTSLEVANTVVSLSNASLGMVNLIYDIIRKLTAP